MLPLTFIIHSRLPYENVPHFNTFIQYLHLAGGLLRVPQTNKKKKNIVVVSNNKCLPLAINGTFTLNIDKIAWLRMQFAWHLLLNLYVSLSVCLSSGEWKVTNIIVDLEKRCQFYGHFYMKF